MTELTLQDRKKITERYYRGDNLNQIAADYHIKPHQVKKQLEEGLTRTEIEKRYLEIHTVRENNRITELKDSALTFIKEALEEGIDHENKLAVLDKVSKVIEQMDRIYRLNNDKATGINENRNINVDVAETMKELKTADDKKAFLLNQLHKN